MHSRCYLVFGHSWYIAVLVGRDQLSMANDGASKTMAGDDGDRSSATWTCLTSSGARLVGVGGPDVNFFLVTGIFLSNSGIGRTRSDW